MSDKDNGEHAPEDAMQDMIGRQLRNLYDSVLAEPLPDRIVELLMQLDDVSGSGPERKDGFPTSLSESAQPGNDNATERK